VQEDPFQAVRGNCTFLSGSLGLHDTFETLLTDQSADEKNEIDENLYVLFLNLTENPKLNVPAIAQQSARKTFFDEKLQLVVPQMMSFSMEMSRLTFWSNPLWNRILEELKPYVSFLLSNFPSFLIFLVFLFFSSFFSLFTFIPFFHFFAPSLPSSRVIFVLSLKG